MNRILFVPILISGLLFSISAIASTAPQDATPEERQKALDYLADTNRGLFDSVRGLSDAQWSFKPAPDRWSIAEVVEHITVIQDVVSGILGNMNAAPLAPEGRDTARIDAEILTKFRTGPRNTKLLRKPCQTAVGRPRSPSPISRTPVSKFAPRSRRPTICAPMSSVIRSSDPGIATSGSSEAPPTPHATLNRSSK
jgi:hypothetical protein